MSSRPVPGGRYFRELRSTYGSMEARDTGEMFKGEYRRVISPSLEAMGITSQTRSNLVYEMMDDPNTRRLIFDADQAQIFAIVRDAPPIYEPLHTPFDQMYIEFTDPVVFLEMEDGLIEETVAILIGKETTGEYGIDKEKTVRLRLLPIIVMVFAYDDEGEKFYTDRGFIYSPETGIGITHLENLQEEFNDVSTYIDESLVNVRDNPTGISVRSPETDEIEGNHRGKWERMVWDYSCFISWLLSYMTAKGIEIVDIPLSRQQRRVLERSKDPKPWHIVRVKPTVVHPNTDVHEASEGRHVSYRFDVRGFLRFGKHKRKDGTYTFTREWVRPHQRGLRNAKYLPSTHTYDKKD